MQNLTRLLQNPKGMQRVLKNKGILMDSDIHNGNHDAHDGTYSVNINGTIDGN